MNMITQKQFEDLRAALDWDCQHHLAAHGKWSLDAGKLGCAMEAVGIRIEGVPHIPQAKETSD